MVLSKNDIKKRCDANQLIQPLDDVNIQPSSYDLRFSGEYYYYEKKDHEEVVIKRLKKNQELRIPPDAICFVLSEEIINMPLDLTGEISLSFGLIKSGVMIAKQPPIDPGYHGRIVGMLHNLSNKEVVIKKNAHIMSIIFHKLSETLKEAEAYNGSYQGLNDLEEFCTSVIKGAIYTLEQNVAKYKERIERNVPNILTVITAILGLITIGLTILTVILLNKTGEAPVSPTPTVSQPINNVPTDSIDISSENGQLVIHYDPDKNIVEIDKDKVIIK